MKRIFSAAGFFILLAVNFTSAQIQRPGEQPVATFSIVGCDTTVGEVGIAVASKFFTVGNVVPWAKAGVGAIATQSFANTSFGWRGLELLEKGLTPEEVKTVLLRDDDNPTRRQFGIVSVIGQSVSYTGENCIPWAGGRNGFNYAIQGNILAGEAVASAMENAFLGTKGNLAERLYAALVAGEKNGGDSRGKQSAALLVVKEGAGYGGYTDRAIDIRVDDHAQPFKELGRILKIAQMNYAWNESWTLFTKGRAGEALPFQEKAVKLAPKDGAVWYDLAVIRLAAGKPESALVALEKAIALNPKLKDAASKDGDLKDLHNSSRFKVLLK